MTGQAGMRGCIESSPVGPDFEMEFLTGPSHHEERKVRTMEGRI